MYITGHPSFLFAGWKYGLPPTWLLECCTRFTSPVMWSVLAWLEINLPSFLFIWWLEIWPSTYVIALLHQNHISSYVIFSSWIRDFWVTGLLMLHSDSSSMSFMSCWITGTENLRRLHQKVHLRSLELGFRSCFFTKTWSWSRTDNIVDQRMSRYEDNWHKN